MAWALLFWALLSCTAENLLTQPPPQSVSPEETVKLPCTGSGGGSWNYFSWYRQQPGQRPQFVLSKGEGIPDRFSGSGYQGNPNYLTITNAQAEDEAEYYCAAWEHSVRVTSTLHPQVALPGQESQVSPPCSLSSRAFGSGCQGGWTPGDLVSLEDATGQRGHTQGSKTATPLLPPPQAGKKHFHALQFPLNLKCPIAGNEEKNGSSFMNCAKTYPTGTVRLPLAPDASL
uniref:Ig-like domain-containing protein n=1 Tax=Varanus komodoensis TaxID=61221 RepID=A0A8D2L7R7_VARKO